MTTSEAVEHNVELAKCHFALGELGWLSFR
jgi:hypothetical protein